MYKNQNSKYNDKQNMLHTVIIRAKTTITHMKWALMGNRLMWSRKYRLHFTICHRNIPNAARELEKTDKVNSNLQEFESVNSSLQPLPMCCQEHQHQLCIPPYIQELLTHHHQHQLTTCFEQEYRSILKATQTSKSFRSPIHCESNHVTTKIKTKYVCHVE